MTIYAYCWASGVIHFGASVPHGAIGIAKGERQAVVDLIEATARHAHDGTTLLVPGVPEAEVDAHDTSKPEALEVWLAWLARCRSRSGVSILGASEGA